MMLPRVRVGVRLQFLFIPNECERFLRGNYNVMLYPALVKTQHSDRPELLG